MRAFYLDRLPSAEAARRFGYSPGAFRVLCHAFRHGDLADFFATTRPGPREQPKKSRAHDQIVALRKRNYSVYEISQTLKEQGTPFAGTSLNLDFHSVPYFGEHPLVESHYLSKRSRRQPSILVFLAQDADAQVFCYSNADIRKGEEADEIFRFIDFWKHQHGKAPQHLVFDSLPHQAAAHRHPT